MHVRFCLFVALFMLSAISRAENFGPFKSCGDYQVSGIFKIKDQGFGFRYIIFEGSKSEIALDVKRSDESKIAPYLNRPSLVRAHFTKAITQQKGEFAILSIESRIPHPLKGAHDSGFILLKEKQCL